MFGKWVFGVACASIIASIAATAAPQGAAGRAAKLTGGFLIVAALLSPVADFDFSAFSRSVFDLREQADAVSADILETNEKLTALIIERECAAYIVDKSARIGMEGLEAEVSAQWSVDGYWYPVEARLTASATLGQRAEITRYVESELGISPERVIWTGKD
ncbi:MAG: hypothetical protein LBJ84_01055 [Oscillospiraceae bacterium]|jgi:stage III sporulation protein AF|nr:hypothetical protein [Oscillospiraceae bacterium]